MQPDPAETFSWRQVAIPVYGPTLLVSIGAGAILPLVALSARELGASIGVAALVVAMLGIGQLVGDLPAGALAARIGERRALILACLIDVCALIGAFLAPTVVLLSAAVFVAGLANAVFSLARQTYLTAAVPLRIRARAMSTLGGVFRIGSFVGPFVGAIIVTRSNIASAYVFAAVMSLLAAGLSALLPDLAPPADKPGSDERGGRQDPSQAQPTVFSVLAKHRRILLTLGTGVLVLSAARATRQAIIPLWAEAQGIDAATTSIIFGISAGVDILLFYPGGAIMDRYGRAAVAIPAMITLGVGFVLLPLTDTAVTVGTVACLMGLGNGISSGVVLTLGADAAPVEGRSQFLGGWRLCADLGNALGPLAIGAISAIATLGLATVVMGAITWLGSAWLARWIPVKSQR
ncbi:putative major facilitator superfamily transporter [Microlunatus phosphovorus NM-1]|uniref:Putative major facilitator superfamily transporter n=1 Tax=Microlunatus phosphovorus (strain ATCC 700054 / DSM 10555 / JCM 9379 / NBRC 101784 / NCIMB 13414 / VKM Ac-1990 / NM-1) TaxID=1032480 RepID=F5XP95_MICPN|nr:MFS transporter [Microlunatus phosphovorus]BAK36735.1 putative major facilitator superfamily transporter [Microlunatus phosphovorus NM-1]